MHDECVSQLESRYLSRAEGMLHQALQDENYERIKSLRVRVTIPQSLGQVYRDLGIYSEASQWLRKSLDVCTDEQGGLLQASILLDLASAKRLSGQLRGAADMYRRAADAFRAEGSLTDAFSAICLQAQVYLEVRDFETAERTCHVLLDQQISEGASLADDTVQQTMEILADALDGLGNSHAANEIRHRAWLAKSDVGQQASSLQQGLL